MIKYCMNKEKENSNKWRFKIEFDRRRMKKGG